MTNTEYVQSILHRKFSPSRMHADQGEVVAAMAAIAEQAAADARIIVSVIGGAASGKSTIAEELVAFLQKNHVKADMLCTDNYARGDREYRQVTIKNADATRKYDLALLDEHVTAIRNLKTGQSIKVPLIDDQTGIAADAKQSDYEYEIGALDILIVEGDLPRDDYDVRFYIHMPDHRRLENNIERDAETAKEADTLTEHFNVRQRTLHKPHTLPALESADYVIATDAEGDDWWYNMYRKKAA